MGEATLLFGLGANKAGTSWLYRYLEAHPECHLRSPKELHYFDAEDRGTRGFQLRELDRQVAEAEARLASGKGNDAYLTRRIEDLTAWRAVMAAGMDDTAYRDFLAGGAAEGTRLLGDLTPAYGLLGEERLCQMAGLAPATRFLLLLRDPVERLWSNIRMMAGWQQGDLSRRAKRADALAESYLQGDQPELEERSDYAGILGRVRRAVPEKSLLTGFYETLFTQDSIDRICRFLGISPRPGRFDMRVWASPEVPLDPALRARLKARLAPQYDYVRSALGPLPGAWGADMVEV
jgi:hypothetical protein